MDIVRFKGGLGNQMFQYAFVEVLRSKGRDVKCNLGFYRKHIDLMPFVLSDVFTRVDIEEIDDETFDKIDCAWKTIKQDVEKRMQFEQDIENCFFYVEKNSRTFYPEIFQTKNCVFIGYWQTEKYFREIKSRVKEAFSFNVQDEKLKELGNELRHNYVGVHVRRGDYLLYPQFQVCGIEYYKHAMQTMKEMRRNIKFIFFSDDKKWVKDAFGDEVVIFNDEIFADYQDWYDMYLMSQCECGNIICNSTFSWWGAWLNQSENKIVIAPEVWNLECATPDILCEGWIRLKNI